MDPENTLIMELDTGPVTIKLRPDLAPGHVERIKELTREGFYDGVVFHRVIPGFMAQGGDPTGTGYHGSDLPNIKAEFSATPHEFLDAGTDVVVLGRYRGVAKGTGKQLDVPFAHVWTLRDGKATCFRQFLDTAGWIGALSD